MSSDLASLQSLPPARRGTALRVVVQCDQHLTAEAIRVALESHRFSVASAAHPHRTPQTHDVARVVQEFDPQVGLLVQELLDPLRIRDSLAILREVTAVPWLLLSGSPQGAGWGAGLEAGARAVLPMDTGLGRVTRALVSVAAGEEVMAPTTRRRTLSAWHESGAEQRGILERIERLSPREMDVLRCLSSGQGVRHIAEDNGVLVATVRSQVKSLLRKLEVRSQIAAVAMLQEALFGPRLTGTFRPPA